MLSGLPLEILEKILSFLPLKDVLNLSSVSQIFSSAASLVYSRRRNRICDLYGLHQPISCQSFVEIRKLLFSNYGHIVGLWQVVSMPYGGLVKVKFDGFQLIGQQFFTPPAPHIQNDLRKRELFVIKVNNEGQCECFCFRGYRGPHKADIFQFESEGFELRCQGLEIHHHPEGPAVEFDSWLREELGLQKVDEVHRTDLLSSKFAAISEEISLKCRPLCLPSFRDDAVPIQPGLFKGSYSSHGLEIVQLTYGDDDSAVLTKITGDPNIPAGKKTIVVDLKIPADDVNRLDEGDGEEAEAAEEDNFVQLLSSEDVPLKPFKLPSFVSSDYEDIPKFYCHRFSSRGQIALTGYQNPTFVPGLWVVFDEDTFGHVWLFLAEFSIFKRVSEIS